MHACMHACMHAVTPLLNRGSTHPPPDLEFLKRENKMKMSQQVRFAPIFENLTQNHASLVPVKNLVPYFPPSPPPSPPPKPPKKLAPDQVLKIENSGICSGPLKILPQTIVTLLPTQQFYFVNQ